MFAGEYRMHDILMNVLKITLTFMPSEKVLVGFWFLKALFTAAVFVSIYCYLLNKFNLRKLRPFILIFILAICLFMNDVGHRSATVFGMFYTGLCFMSLVLLSKNTRQTYITTFC